MPNLLMKYVITYVVFVLLSTAQWFHRKFHKVEIDQFLYHLERSSENVIKADFPLINSAIKNCVLAPLVYALLFLVLVFMAERVLKKISLQFSLSATLYSPVSIVISMALGVIYFLNLNIQLANPFVENRDWVAHFYAEPQVLSAPDKKRNLVLIYAESMETSLESLYPNDHLFDSLSFKNHAPVSFGSFPQLTDTGWTIAGMTSSQCGIPLKPLGIFNGDNIGESTTKFMPNAKCLGDVLKEYGYKNVFIGGASSDYSGKNLFLETHGYGEIYGRSEFIKMNSQIALNAWGANDDELFKFAKEKFLKLKAENNPFNLTLLTLGMHFPDGFLSPSCPSRYGDYRDPILCNSFLIKDFVDFIKANEGAIDTDIVIVGDHLTMKASIAKALEHKTDRSIFNLFISRDKDETPNRSQINHFDLFPTILQQLNFELKNGRAGLGCSGFDQVNCSSISTVDQINDKLHKYSSFYESLWTN